MILLLLASLAYAEPLPPVGISLEPPEEQLRFRERRLAAGAPEGAAELACRAFAEGLSLCFTWEDGGTRRYVTGDDLARWQATLAQVEAAAVARAAQALGPGRPERTPVTDMDATYWLSMEGDGLDLAGFLAPAALVEHCGAELRVAVPARDVFVAWNGGSADLDKVLAVGVARIHDAAEHPVTARIFAWDEATGTWQVWGQALR